MQISANTPKYDSTINNNAAIQQTKPLNTIKQFKEAYRVDLSSNALSSKEFNDPSINFPTHNTNVLEYTNNLDLVFKPYSIY